MKYAIELLTDKLSQMEKRHPSPLAFTEARADLRRAIEVLEGVPTPEQEQAAEEVRLLQEDQIRDEMRNRR